MSHPELDLQKSLGLSKKVRSKNLVQNFFRTTTLPSSTRIHRTQQQKEQPRHSKNQKGKHVAKGRISTKTLYANLCAASAKHKTKTANSPKSPAIDWPQKSANQSHNFMDQVKWINRSIDFKGLQPVASEVLPAQWLPHQPPTFSALYQQVVEYV